MNFKQTKKSFLAAIMAILLSAGTTIAASAPAVYAAENKGSIMLDTANYIMAPGNIYDIGVTIKDPSGNKLTANQVKDLVSSGKLNVQDSRTGSIVNLQQLPNGNFRVTGKNVGTCYIVYDIGGTHASVRIDVQRGVKQHGTAVRNTSLFTKDVDFSREYYAEDFIGMTYGELVAKFGKNYTKGGTAYTGGGGRYIQYPQLPGMVFAFSEYIWDDQGGYAFSNSDKISYVFMTDSGKINPTLRANFNLAQLENAAKNLKNVTIKSEKYYGDMEGNAYRFSIQSSNVLILYDWYFDHGASLSGPASRIIVMPN